MDETVELWTCRCGKTLLPTGFPGHICEPGPSPFHIVDFTGYDKVPVETLKGEKDGRDYNHQL